MVCSKNYLGGLKKNNHMILFITLTIIAYACILSMSECVGIVWTKKREREKERKKKIQRESAFSWTTKQQ